MDKPYEKKIYFGMAIDPVHIGTGGYTLGRVDNPTVREFGLPKIPGTSIEGTTRAYTAIQFNQLACASKEEHKTKCPKRNVNCPICTSFGYTESELVDKPKSLQGLALFSDAKILFFPVSSLIGPIWITCPNGLKELNVDQNIWQDFDEGEFCIVSESMKPKLENVGYLNFGWLLLQLKKDNSQIVTHSITSETMFEVDDSKLRFRDREFDKKEIFDRLVIVSDSVFSQIVNSNLEIRTSVSIDPTTGTAEDSALFTYEAIPRTTIFYFGVVYQKPEHFGLDSSLNDIVSTVETGFSLLEFLGVGGMGTRGFGKFRVFGLDKQFDKVKLSETQTGNIVAEIKALKDKLKDAKSDEEQNSIDEKIRDKKEEVKRMAEEIQKIANIWEKTYEVIQNEQYPSEN